MVPEINVHNVKNVIVKQHQIHRPNGDAWFVNKDIIVVDDSGEEVLKILLYGDNFEAVRFQSQAEYDGLLDENVDVLDQILEVS